MMAYRITNYDIASLVLLLTPFIYFVLLLTYNTFTHFLSLIIHNQRMNTFRMEVPLGAGSGFVWDDKGHIVKNYYFVRNAKSAQVAILTKRSPDEADVDKQPNKPVVSSVQRSIA